MENPLSQNLLFLVMADISAIGLICIFSVHIHVYVAETARN